MRTIKFRVWNSDDNKMEFPIAFAMSDGKLKPLIKCADGNSAYKDYPIMQFTGLPCRNEDGSSGELFKGDIVRDYMDEVVGVIDWYYDMWVVKVDLPCKYKRIGSWDDWVKIGNEFENPELLTKN